MLLLARQRFGNKWSAISKELPGRSENATKNHFYSTIRRSLRQYNKGKPISQRITESVSSILQNPKILDHLIEFSTIRSNKKLTQISGHVCENVKLPPGGFLEEIRFVNLNMLARP